VAADRLGELEEVVAYHLEQAALYRRELDLPDEREAGRRAAELLVRSGMRAYDRGDLPAAEHLLSRAVSLRPQGDRLRVRALPLLGATILDAAGGMERALDILGRALDESRIAGDRAAEASAWALRNLVRQQSEPALDLEAMQRDVEKRAPEIERLGDGRALVYLRRLELSMALRRLSGLGAAAERLLAAARSAGDRRNALEAVYFLNAWWVVGPMPVEEALAATQRMRALAQGPAEEVAVGHMEGLLLGMRGELDEGRRLIREARAAYAELGVTLTAVASARDEALIERYAGDPAAVERVLRPACDELREAGETGYLSTHVGEFADALYELGRYGEAEEACLESERLTQEGDIYSQVVWRRVRAKLLAQKGKGDEALRLAREAIEWAEKDMPEPLGDAYRDLAEVERTAGHAGRAEEALERALATYERKGLVPMAERTRGELATLRANV
jgi:tetratricopeptide (TPR) repeat protein